MVAFCCCSIGDAQEIFYISLFGEKPLPGAMKVHVPAIAAPGGAQKLFFWEPEMSKFIVSIFRNLLKI